MKRQRKLKWQCPNKPNRISNVRTWRMQFDRRFDAISTKRRLKYSAHILLSVVCVWLLQRLFYRLPRMNADGSYFLPFFSLSLQFAPQTVFLSQLSFIVNMILMIDCCKIHSYPYLRLCEIFWEMCNHHNRMKWEITNANLHHSYHTIFKRNN